MACVHGERLRCQRCEDGKVEEVEQVKWPHAVDWKKFWEEMYVEARTPEERQSLHRIWEAAMGERPKPKPPLDKQLTSAQQKAIERIKQGKSVMFAVSVEDIGAYRNPPYKMFSEGLFVVNCDFKNLKWITFSPNGRGLADG